MSLTLLQPISRDELRFLAPEWFEWRAYATNADYFIFRSPDGADLKISGMLATAMHARDVFYAIARGLEEFSDPLDTWSAGYLPFGFHFVRSTPKSNRHWTISYAMAHASGALPLLRAFGQYLRAAGKVAR